MNTKIGRPIQEYKLFIDYTITVWHWILNDIIKLISISIMDAKHEPTASVANNLHL